VTSERQTPDTQAYLAERMRDPEFGTEFEAAAAELAARPDDPDARLRTSPSYPEVAGGLNHGADSVRGR